MCNPDDGLSGGDSGDSAGDDIYAQRSMRFKTRVMPICVTSSAPDLTFVRRGHHERRTHAASRSGTSGPVLCCFDLSAIHGSMDSKLLLELKNETEPMFLSFYVALGPFLLLAARKPSSHRSLIAFAACARAFSSVKRTKILNSAFYSMQT